ncbi:MAG: protein kinase [Polyangia bacterium]
MTIRVPDSHHAPPAGLVPGFDVLGAYHLLRPLGKGGMAVVWLAVDSRSGRQVAIKRMLPGIAADEELRRAFVDEAQLGLRLRHPGIVETIELGEVTTATGVEPYIVLELLQGRGLIDLLRATGRRKVTLPLDVIVRTVVDAARALDFAHQLVGPDGHKLGVVHRDVSPHNVFVCADGSIKLLDFGIAKMADQSHKTRTGLIKGKLAYLAPEQIRGKGVDHRCDVFALGIVLHELLVGRPLFRGGNDAETLHRVLTHDVEAPDSLRGDVPSGLGAIALRALHRDRDRRLPTAGALADAVEAVAEAEHIVGTHDSVRGFAQVLFPDDDAEHAEDSALARRTYAHLSSTSLRALGSNPWLTPPEGVPPTSPRRTSRFALLAGALLVTATAAFVTTRVLKHHDGRPTLAVAPVIVAPPIVAPPIVRPPTVPPVLEPAMAPPIPTPARPVAMRAPKIAPPKVIAPKRKVVAHGSLRLAAQPWAEVRVDGKALGTTPLRSTEIAEGAHTVVLSNHDLGVVVRRKVIVHAGQETVLVVNLFAEKK